jgi:hypothetical protein
LIGMTPQAPHALDGADISTWLTGATHRDKPMGFWHKFQGGQSTHSDRILKAIYEQQQASAKPPHNPARMAKDVAEFPQFAEDYAKGHAAWTDWPWKLHRINADKYELYDLANDAMEEHNVVAEAGQAERVTRMKSELHRWMRSVVRSVNGKDY